MDTTKSSGKLKLQCPLKQTIINQPFGANFNNFYKEMGMKGHNGIDFYALDGTEVYASHDGRVTFTGYDGAGGLGVVIRTEEKFDYYEPKTGEYNPTYFKTIYWHLKKDSIKVTGSQKVKAGDLIGLADNTGRSTGAHLHFGLKPIYRGEEEWNWWNAEQENGYAGSIDPMPYFTTASETPLIKRIKALQAFLNENGANLKVDGKWGKLSQKALDEFLK